MTGHGAAANGLMAYRKYGEGSGDAVVLLHAFPLNSRMWRSQAEALAGDRRVIGVLNLGDIVKAGIV